MSPRVFLLFIATAMLVSIGCQQSMSNRLEGKWVGRPDSAEAAADRSARLKAEQQGAAEESPAVPVDDMPPAARQRTELEQHDVEIHLDFAADKQVTMSLGNDREPLHGVWRVVATLPPDGAEIEIHLKPPGESSTAAPTSGERREKRRFIIDFQKHGAEAGFTLMEKGADPQFGRLYFVRQQ